MNLDIRSRGFELTPPLRHFTERKLAFALSRFAPHLGGVTIRLEDLNGPKGGEDKRCRLEARLDGLPVVIAEAVDADLYTAIGASAERLGRAVARAISRSQDRVPA